MELKGNFQDGLPFISIRVEEKEFTALVDTGYNGFVMLASSEIHRLRLKELGKTVYRTADGQFHEGKIYQGRVEWFGKEIDVAIDSTAGDFALVGMKMLQSLRLVMEPSKSVLSLSSISK